MYHEIFGSNADEERPSSHEAARVREAPRGERISSGSTAVVFREKDIATKTVRGSAIATTITEIAILTALDHPNVIKLHSITFARESISFTMKYYQCTLETYIAAKSEIGRIEDIISGIASALAYIHGRGVIHADIKPANIFVKMGMSMRVTAIVADFGLSRLVCSPPCLHYVQTPIYRAPEVNVGAIVTPAIDLWSLGVIAAELAGVRAVVDTEDGTRYACEYYGLPHGCNRDQNIAQITAAGEDRCASALSRRLGSVSAQHREACVGMLRFNPKRRLSAHETLAVLGRATSMLPRPRPIVRDDAPLSSVASITLAKKYPDLSVTTTATGAEGLAKILCGQLPNLTSDELKCAKKMLSRAHGKVL